MALFGIIQIKQHWPWRTFWKDLKSYLSKISDEALYAYNVYQIEGEGKNLFSEINGNKDTIMGLPIKEIKKYLEITEWKNFVIGNPIQHSLSPQIHNYWIKKIILMQVYEKLNKEELEN